MGRAGHDPQSRGAVVVIGDDLHDASSGGQGAGVAPIAVSAWLRAASSTSDGAPLAPMAPRSTPSFQMGSEPVAGSMGAPYPRVPATPQTIGLSRYRWASAWPGWPPVATLAKAFPRATSIVT